MPLVYCNYCGSPIDKPLQWIQRQRERHFCNQECYHKWSTEHRKKRVRRRCLTCGKEFETIKGHIRASTQGAYCSISCFAKSRIGDRNPFKGKHHSPNAKMVIGLKSKERKAILATPNFARPNKKEIYFRDLLERYFPKQWEYVGNGKLIINGLIPDFANINGQKALIEFFGDYWHSPQLTQDEWRRTELGRIMVFNSLGYRSLVIWEHELKDEQAVVSKIQQFMRR